MPPQSAVPELAAKTARKLPNYMDEIRVPSGVKPNRTPFAWIAPRSFAPCRRPARSAIWMAREWNGDPAKRHGRWRSCQSAARPLAPSMPMQWASLCSSAERRAAQLEHCVGVVQALHCAYTAFKMSLRAHCVYHASTLRLPCHLCIAGEPLAAHAARRRTRRRVGARGRRVGRRTVPNPSPSPNPSLNPKL